MSIVSELLDKMTLKEKIYQTIIIHSDNRFYENDDGFIKNYAEEKPYGGVFVGEEIIGGTIATGDIIPKNVKRYVSYTKVKPFICADTEFGCGYMFPDGRYSDLPWQMTLGATDNEDLAYKYGQHTAIAAKEIGINLSLAPVCDLNMEFQNPVVNTRSLGDDPKRVAKLVTQITKGMQDYGLGATAKHFPGDGTDYRDQHYVVTNNCLSKRKWMQTFGYVYKKLIESGVLAIMIGHITFSSYQKERIDGFSLPATLSKELITSLLKKRLKFQGVVMSDAVIMNGFRAVYGSQEKAEIACFKAGIDMVLWPSESFADNLEQAIKSGEVPIERLNDAVARILTAKNKLGLLGEEKIFKTGKLQELGDLDKEISEQGITLVRDRRNCLPLKNLKRVSIIGITNYDDEFESLKTMQEAFESRNIQAFLHRNEVACDNWEEGLDLIIYVTFCKEHKPCGPLAITPSWQTMSYKREKCLAVAMGSPYLINSNFPTANMAIATYSSTVGCMEAVVKSITGEIPFKGELPVKLQHI